jgi:K(+)-stimulated pyrophosphate-energized sodium pump
MDASTLLPIIPLAGIIAVLFAIYLARDVLARDTGTPEMQAVAGTILEGAVAFIRRQYTTIFVLAVVGAFVIGGVITLVETPEVADVPKLAGVPIGIMTAFAFFVGALCSMASGVIGMYISVKANVRTASAARRSLVEAVQVAMRGGAVSGFLVVALSLLGVWGIFTLYETVVADVTVSEAPFLIVGFGFGASFVALSRISAAASTRRPPMSAPTSSVRSRRASRRTIPATRASSRTWSAITSAIAPAVVPISSNPLPPRTSAR